MTTAIHTAPLTEGPVGLTLVRMTVAMFWGILAVISFQVADALFVGQLGTESLAALSFTFPVGMILTNLAIGLGIGTSSLLSKALGRGDSSLVHRLGTYALSLSLMIGVVVAFLGYLSIDPLFRLLGASENHLVIIREYMSLVYAIFPLMVCIIVANFAMCSLGEIRLPARLMILLSVINIVLDPFLIYGWGFFPKFGVTGAALSSLVAEMIIFLVSLRIVLTQVPLLTRHQLSVPEFVKSMHDFTKVGLPAAIANMVIPFSLGVVMTIIASYGDEAVAAFGVATHIETFSLILPLALSSVLGPFVGQNWGAAKPERIHHALSLVIRFCMFWGLAFVLILAVAGGMIVRLFDADPQVVAIGQSYFWIVPVSYLGYSVVMNVSAMFNALGRSLPTLLLSCLRMFVLYIPLAYALQLYTGLEGIFWAACLANMIAGTVAWFWQRKTIRQIL